MKGKQSHEAKPMEHPGKHPVMGHKRASGGRLTEEYEEGGKPAPKTEPKPQSGMKRGGAHRKAGGKVHGKHPGHRLDKRARGGRMTPKDPYSGADAKDLGYAKGDLKAGSEGAGKDRT